MRFNIENDSRPSWVRTRRGGRAPLGAFLVLELLAASHGPAQTATVSVVPDADAFVRSVASTSNYGIAGALSVSGSAALNGSGVQNGLLDSLMCFPMSNVVATLNSALGGNDWIVTQAELVCTEMAAPDNDLFNRGVGAFEVRWVTTDGWVEGTGRPIGPTTDGVAWQDLHSILNSNLDQSLGMFTNSGSNAQESFFLELADRFLADVRAGGELGLYLTAASPTVGFTFDSRNFGNTNAQPFLRVSAVANPRPRIDGIGLTGTNVSVSFGTVSNWNYTLQCADCVAGGSSAWSNLATVARQSTNGQAVFLDGPMNRQRFYRLSASP